ncbi:Sporulation inhibitor A [Mesobacillus persicus]|uniref:Sporulation inhibitor A n=1 Tax=Mesobacillus persicus TaxID=930146 RepID=A0A1H8JV70_9BACI|nr:sporulation histidine kinase inhibitor Sda [Mesobacillus persicus]SEN84613.1 Sporulation inhibitor A [Mesobacillus persicus]
MNKLSDDFLLEVYEKAIALDVDQEFINLLKQEMKRRKEIGHKYNQSASSPQS